MAAPTNKIKFVENIDSLGLKTDNSKSNTYYFVSNLFDNGSTLINLLLTSLLKQRFLFDHANLYDANQCERFLTLSNSAYSVKGLCRAELIRNHFK